MFKWSHIRIPPPVGLVFVVFEHTFQSHYNTYISWCPISVRLTQAYQIPFKYTCPSKKSGHIRATNVLGGQTLKWHLLFDQKMHDIPYPICVVISFLCGYKTLEQRATSCYAVLGLRLMQNHEFMFYLITYESLVWQSTWTYHVVVQWLGKKKISLQLRSVKDKCFAILVSNFKAMGVTNFFEAKTSALSKFKEIQVPFPRFVPLSTWSTLVAH